VLELQFSLIQDELDHDAGDQGECDRRHEDKVVRASSLFAVLECLVNWERLSRDIKCEVIVSCGDFQDSLVEILRVHGGHILTRNVQKVDYLVQVKPLISLIKLVGAITVWEELAFVTCLVDGLIEFIVCQIIIYVLNFEGISAVGKSSE